MQCRFVRAAVYAVAALGCAASVPAQVAPVWRVQFGVAGYDYTSDLTLDPQGNVFVSGYTSDDIAGGGANGMDALLAHYRADGSHVWTRQYGSSQNDYASGIARDAGGGLHVAAYSFGSFAGQPNLGDLDAALLDVDANGILTRSRQFGTPGTDFACEVKIGRTGDVFVSGNTSGLLGGLTLGGYDGYLRKYNADGSLAWTRHAGTSLDDFWGAMAIDQEDSAVVGVSQGGSSDLSGSITQVRSDGTVSWTRALDPDLQGGVGDIAIGPAGRIYVSGTTSRGEIGGGSDATVSCYTNGGDLLWTRKFGSGADDNGGYLAIDSFGNAYLAGETSGSLEGTNNGFKDLYLARIDADGTLAWLEQFGSEEDDYFTGISIYRGDLVLGGWTRGNLFGANLGATDGFIARYHVIPEPVALSVFAAVFLCTRHTRRSR